MPEQAGQQDAAARRAPIGPKQVALAHRDLPRRPGLCVPSRSGRISVVVTSCIVKSSDEAQLPSVKTTSNRTVLAPITAYFGITTLTLAS